MKNHKTSSKAKSNEVKLNLNCFDSCGDMTGETKVKTLSLEALSDIIDHATQAIIARRAGAPTRDILDELDEVLSTYDIVEAD